MKRRVLAAILVVLLLIGSTSALAAAGSSGDPLISLSYVETYVRSVLNQAREVFAQPLREIVDGRLASAGTDAQSGFVSTQAATGSQVKMDFGDSVILLSGTATVTVTSGEVVNVSTGDTVSSGSQLSIGQRYMVMEDSSAAVNILSSAALMTEGAVDITQGTTSQRFADVPESHWAFGYINELAEKGIVGGVGGGLFAPEANMTRADFVTVLGRLYGVDTSAYGGSSFTDVPVGQYYTPYVQWAASNGIVTGYGGGLFGPRDNITRDQMAAIIVRYAGFAGISLPNNGSTNVFADDAAIQSWARDAVYTAMRAGLIGGKGGNIFDPTGKSTRAEVCTVISRLINI